MLKKQNQSKILIVIKKNTNLERLLSLTRLIRPIFRKESNFAMLIFSRNLSQSCLFFLKSTFQVCLVHAGPTPPKQALVHAYFFSKSNIAMLIKSMLIKKACSCLHFVSYFFSILNACILHSNLLDSNINYSMICYPGSLLFKHIASLPGTVKPQTSPARDLFNFKGQKCGAYSRGFILLI